MVTLVFVIVTGFSLVLVSAIDVYLYQESLLESLDSVLFMEVGTGRLILILTFLFGFASAGLADYQIHKNNNKKNNSESNV